MKIKKEPLSIIELFSGLGAQKYGIDMTNLYDGNVIATSEINKEATVSYATIHNGLTNEYIDSYDNYPSEEVMREELLCKNIGYDFKKKTNPVSRLKGKKLKTFWMAMKLSNNMGDISRIESLPYTDLLTYSFPCTDISVAGKQKGIVKGGTRSGLLYEVERLLEISKKQGTLPKYLLLENVKNLVGKSFIHQFKKWCGRLDEFGYNTYYQVLNGKNCGIPQNRERVFAISIRKDIDTKKYTFPEEFDLGIRLKDLLEETVEESYYLSDERVTQFIDDLMKKDISILFNKMKNEINKIGNYLDGSNTNAQTGRIYAPEGVSPTLCTASGGSHEPKILLQELLEDTLNLKTFHLRIRKLTPRECFRLMGFTDESFNRVLDLNIAKNQMYTQAGNSIITNCIALLMEHLYQAQIDNSYICTDQWIVENKWEDKPENKLIFLGGFLNGVWLENGKSYSRNYKQGYRVYDPNNIACALTANGGGLGANSGLYMIVAERGRYNEQGKVTQQLELGSDEHSNCLTTVQKDNYLCIIKQKD